MAGHSKWAKVKHFKGRFVGSRKPLDFLGAKCCPLHEAIDRHGKTPLCRNAFNSIVMARDFKRED